MPKSCARASVSLAYATRRSQDWRRSQYNGECRKPNNKVEAKVKQENAMTTDVTIKQAKKMTTTSVVKQRKGKLSISEKKKLSIKTFIKFAIESKGKCYMLSFDTPDARICRINDIIAELVKNGYMIKMEPTLKNSILFLSSYNFKKLFIKKVL